MRYNYGVIEATRLQTFIDMVKESLDEGFQLQGGVSFNPINNTYVQAIIKPSIAKESADTT